MPIQSLKLNTGASTSNGYINNILGLKIQGASTALQSIIPQNNPQDYPRRFAEFMTMDEEDKQDYLTALKDEINTGNQNALEFECYLMKQLGRLCERDAQMEAQKQKRKKTIIFAVVMLGLGVAAWYFLFKK